MPQESIIVNRFKKSAPCSLSLRKASSHRSLNLHVEWVYKNSYDEFNWFCTATDYMITLLAHRIKILMVVKHEIELVSVVLTLGTPVTPCCPLLWWHRWNHQWGQMAHVLSLHQTCSWSYPESAQSQYAPAANSTLYELSDVFANWKRGSIIITRHV